MSLDPTAHVQEVNDQLAIRTLVDTYAYCADSRDAAGQMALFTEDAHFVVFTDSKADLSFFLFQLSVCGSLDVPLQRCLTVTTTYGNA